MQTILSLANELVVHVEPPMVTEPDVPKKLPVRVSTVPPAVGPLDGFIEKMVGAGGTTLILAVEKVYHAVCQNTG